MTFGPWMMGVFKTAREIQGPARHGSSIPSDARAERKRERALIGEYRATIERLLPKLTPENLAAAAEIASIPEHDPRLWPCEGTPSR